MVAGETLGSPEIDCRLLGRPDAPKACLDAVQTEGSRIASLVTVIDDCSPDADLRALMEDHVALGLFTFLRNGENLGFARSANRPAHERPSDVLLLNADTVLPRGAIDRLAAAAHAEAGIATVTPPLNDGEFTSFPRPNVCNTLPTLAGVEALHDLAGTTNEREIFDLPGVGFRLQSLASAWKPLANLGDLFPRVLVGGRLACFDPLPIGQCGDAAIAVGGPFVD